MRDPHITKLHYTVSCDESLSGVTYDQPEPIFINNEIGTFKLEDWRLEISPSQHFATEAQALRVVEPFLAAWEIQSDLTGRLGEIKFNFERAEIIDRNPPPPEDGRVIHCKTAKFVTHGNPASINIVRKKYPPPPIDFAWSQQLEICHVRWRQFKLGKEPLQSVAYFIFDYLLQEAGTLKKAADRFSISRKILQKVADLSSTKGSLHTSRKAPKDKVFTDLTDDEKNWLETAIQLIIKQIGRCTTDVNVKKLTKSDLPPLDRF